MSKYCTLKDMTPGSVVELPKEFASHEAEKGLIMGLEYNEDKTGVRAELVRQAGEMMITLHMASRDANTAFALADDVVLQKSAIKAFVSSNLALPVMTMTVGCDPEIFVEHANGEVFPAWEYMPSEDEARAKAKGWLAQTWIRSNNLIGPYRSAYPGLHWDNPEAIYCPHHVPAYWDGAQAEFAPWAKSCLETLHFGTREGLKSVLAYARMKDPLAKLTLRNVVELPQRVLTTADDKFIRFRCSQSFNIYDDAGEGIADAREYKYRCAGGHIHLGWKRKLTAPGIEQIMRGLDGVLGVIGVSLAAGIDNPERRVMYGRAGEFRLPSYGIEYRVLSNFWLAHPALSMLVFDLARAIVRLSESGLFNICWVASEQEIRDVINNCDVEGARQILRRNVPVLMGLLKALWASDNNRDKMRTTALQAILNGMDGIIKDPFDIEKNWKLSDEEAWKFHCRGEGDNWSSLTKGL